MKTIDQIRSGFVNSEFYLEYMPIMSLLNNKCVGAEALLRWRHFDELVPPLEIITAIKNSPLIGLITYWMIEQVGKEMGDLLHSDEKIHIGINAPPELIGRGGIAYAIDKAFIEQMTSDRWVSRMISGLSAFARVLGTELIAEGVESKTQVELLRSLGVSMGQGMYFSKPINAEAFLHFYKKNKTKVEI